MKLTIEKLLSLTKSVKDREEIAKMMSNININNRNINNTEKFAETIIEIIEGHEVLLKNLSEQLNCVVNTYNGDGISTFIKKSLRAKFEKKLNKYDIEFQKVGRFYKMKYITIRKFYKIIKSLGENCVVTIGKDLICRGISYVGENIEEPITATTMFYKPGKTMHAVGICQTIGRITGCAMPNLNRTLYCPKDVYETYIAYNKNQESFIKAIEENNELITKVVIDATVFEKYSRPIDRPKLNLKMKMEKKKVNESESSDSEDEETIIDGVNLKKLRNWIDGDTLVGRMINYLYEYEETITFTEFKEGINYEKSDEDFRNNIDGGRSLKAKYGKLWCMKDNTVKLNKNIRKYMDEM